MPIDFELETITPHPSYRSAKEAKADLDRIETQITDPRVADNSFWFFWLDSERELCLKFIAGLNGADQHKSKPKGLIRTMETVEEEEIDFLWANRIPRGKLTNFSGDPGLGKSMVACKIAATLSLGQALPFDKEPEAPLRTLIITAEDGPEDTLKPRLRRMGADMTMIGIPGEKLMPSEITADLIDQMLEEFPSALCIIDPFIAYAGKKNTNNASDARSLVGPVCEIGKKRKTAMVGIWHENKANNQKALYRTQGSMDIVAACRSMFTFGESRQKPGWRWMAHTKASLTILQPTLEFTIDKDGMFYWGGIVEGSADELSKEKGKEPEKREEAKEFLLRMLADGPVASNEIGDRAKKEGISWGTIWRANEELKQAKQIRAFKDKNSGAWFWELKSN